MFIYVVLYELNIVKGINFITDLIQAFAGFNGKGEKRNNTAFIYL
tara:strand:+ start:4653 stop:4787 length:135 start_codon:yes stop_codon:yes gene_type:complete